jgi:hypothetical protein
MNYNFYGAQYAVSLFGVTPTSRKCLAVGFAPTIRKIDLSVGVAPIEITAQKFV